jgi:chemotaxis protein methyltransferase CheR
MIMIWSEGFEKMKLKEKKSRQTETKGNFFLYEPLSEKDFQKLSELIQSHIGIRMPETKKIMLESRLHKRLRALSLQDFPSYCEYLFSDHGFDKELPYLFDVITTNKTDFFREPVHFEYLVEYVLPELISPPRPKSRRLWFWSAGCSTGEEPYSLAMVLQDFKERVGKFDFGIHATDISTQVLETAGTAIYNQDKADPIPITLKKKYLLRSKEKSRKLVRIAPEIRSLVQFSRLNLMDRSYATIPEMDVIFCRNVIIYFDRPTQEILIRNFYRYLRVGGYLFLGHSETLCGISIPLVTVLPTVYKKTG